MKELIVYMALAIISVLIGLSMYMARDRGLIAMMLSGFILYVLPIMLISQRVGFMEAARIVTNQLIKLVDPRIALFVVAALLGYYLGTRRSGNRHRRRKGEEVVFVVE